MGRAGGEILACVRFTVYHLVVPDSRRLSASSFHGSEMIPKHIHRWHCRLFPRQSPSCIWVHHCHGRLIPTTPPDSRITALARTPENECDNVCRCIGMPILHSIDHLGWDSNLGSSNLREREPKR